MRLSEAGTKKKSGFIFSSRGASPISAISIQRKTTRWNVRWFDYRIFLEASSWIPALISRRHMIQAIADMLENRKETFRNSFRNPYSRWNALKALYRHPVTILMSVIIKMSDKVCDTNLSSAFLLTTWWRDEPTPFAKNKSGIQSELISFSSTEQRD